MSSHDIAVLVFKILTILTTVMMRFSLLPDFNRWRKARSTGDMSVMPCVLIFTNCYAVEFYAYAIDDYVPLFCTSMLGVIMGAAFSCFFYRWTDNKREVMKTFVVSVFVCVVIAIYSILALSGRTEQTRHSVGTTLGFITIATTIGMYASPMATIVKVIRTKTASSMPLTMGIVNVLNSICWTIYAALVNNVFIMAPNIAGVVLGTTQMIVTYIYRPVNGETTSHETTVNFSDHHQSLYVDLSKCSNFNELRSPSTTCRSPNTTSKL